MSFLFAFAFKGIRRCVKSPNSLLFGYRQIAINGKFGCCFTLLPELS
ncbi:hypothetical protein KGF34_07780 [Ruminococcus sp. FMBCY1]|nr:hypothetical protein [Ruminococcus sp. FMBCY1]USP69071.1 hypothetical protein KGF34_07780 [Ruminococcus sp. FMBCY1]